MTSGRGPPSRSASAERFLGWLTRPAELDAELPELVTAINRGEGLPDAALVGGSLALAIRDVPGGTIREYRLFPLERAGPRPRPARRQAATWRASRSTWS